MKENLSTSPVSQEIHFVLNGTPTSASPGTNLLHFLREKKGLIAAKNACGQGVCGACAVLVNGKVVNACITPIDKIADCTVQSLEGIDATELDLLSNTFATVGAVQCGYCIPGIIITAKSILDSTPNPSTNDIRKALRRHICRCTGYKKIIKAIKLAAYLKREGKTVEAISSGFGFSGIGIPTPRVEAKKKASGKALFVDDIAALGGDATAEYTDPILFGAVLRSPYPRIMLKSIDVTVARTMKGVATVLTWEDIPGKRFIGHLKDDWPTLIAVGEETRYIGDALALVAATTLEMAQEELQCIKLEYDILQPLCNPDAALGPGAPALHPGGNILARAQLKLGDAKAALDNASFVLEEIFTTPFSEHGFLEPESALAYPPDSKGQLQIYTGEQNVYDGRRYIADTLGLPEHCVRVTSAYIGGAFGGKEDQSVQHHAALLAYHTKRAVRLTLSRQESTRVHVKRHAMRIQMRVGCDAKGILAGLVCRIVADTGAYASLGEPVLRRAVMHAGGPYCYENIDVEGVAVYTNNPPAGAFRGFGVPQVNFAMESALNYLANKVGISPWEIRYLNAVRQGQRLSNNQIADDSTNLEACLLALKPTCDKAKAAGLPIGVACAFKNSGLGSGEEDIGRCKVFVHKDKIEIRSGAACIGQGIATVFMQIACQVLGLNEHQIDVALPDTALCPDSGTTTASRQTLVSGEACRRACQACRSALPSVPPAPTLPPEKGNKDTFIYSVLSGREFYGEFSALTDTPGTNTSQPIHHIAYSYVCQAAILDQTGKVSAIVSANDSGTVINPVAFSGQVEGGVAMGFGYALTENFVLHDCVPIAEFGKLGLPRSTDLPDIELLDIEQKNPKDFHQQIAFGARGIGEISTIPTASAIAGAYFARDGILRLCLPLQDTAYSKV